MQKVTSNAVSLAAAITAFALLILLVVVDIWTGNQLNPAIVYSTLLLACMIAKSRKFLWMLTASCLVGATIPAFFEGEDFRAAVHRGIAVLTIIASAIVLHTLINAWRRARESQVTLERNHAELGAREAEIARQNEELLSQTEELERQSEELRVINDELAARERMLEALLDLSRSLTAELTEDQVMARVCEALETLINEHAAGAAIVEREGGQVRVRCHHGFGPDGIQQDAWAYDRSFASLVIGQGQAGYLEDVALRPDLRLPVPVNGKPFVAILGAPLRVHGKPIGSLEAYSRDKRSWTSEQIAMIESLAAQTSISLETARLFQEIERERRRFEAVFRTLPIGVFVAEDPDCALVRGNPAAAAMYNAPADANFSPIAPVNQRVRRTVLRAGVPVPLDHHPLVRSVRTGQELRGEELDVAFPNGHSISLLVSAAPIFGVDGKIAGGVCAFVDITALKRIEQELDRRRREAEEQSVRKTRFLAAVSHDIRTPANAISLLAELIQRSAPNPAMAKEIPELARDLRASALSLVELVSDVLDVARFDSGRIDLQESEFWLGDAIAEEIRQLQPLANERSLSLELEPIDPPIRLRSDRIKLGRVIGNLAGNAIKFTESGGVRIRARILPETHHVRIDVADTGIGIPEEHLEHIFDEFFQLRNPERDRNKGMGLGLTICKRLVEAMGGTLEARSEPSKGSVFTIMLPPDAVVSTAEGDGEGASASSVSVQNVPSDQPTNADLAGVRVLLVEDHHCTRRATMQMLTGRGAIVDEAPDAATALAQLERFNPQVLLLDMMLPDLDGEEILKILHTRRPPGLGCIFVLTGDATLERMEKIRKLGVDGIVTKPVNFSRLIDQIHQCRVGSADKVNGNENQP